MGKLTLILLALSSAAVIAVVADARVAASRNTDRGVAISIDPDGPTWRAAPFPELGVTDDDLF